MNFTRGVSVEWKEKLDYDRLRSRWEVMKGSLVSVPLPLGNGEGPSKNMNVVNSIIFLIFCAVSSCKQDTFQSDMDQKGLT